MSTALRGHVKDKIASARIGICLAKVRCRKMPTQSRGHGTRQASSCVNLNQREYEMALNRSVVAVAFILAMGPIGADEPVRKADQAKQDLETLQGTWRLDEKETLFFHTLWVDT